MARGIFGRHATARKWGSNYRTETLTQFSAEYTACAYVALRISAHVTPLNPEHMEEAHSNE
jgi:hypothetical protein